MRSHTLWIVIAVIAVILLIVGGVSSALNFLIWVGIVLLVIALILFLLRVLGRGTRGRL